MKYAVFSDIHGNIHALKAALRDAEAQKATKCIFLGDYCYGFPWGDEVAQTLRGLKSAIIIRGNNEGYLIDIHKTPRDGRWACEQFKPIWWAYNSLSEVNLEYLINLPETMDIYDGDERIHIAHSSDIFYRKLRIEPFHSSLLRHIMPKSFTHKEYLEKARGAIMARADALADIGMLAGGVYLNGHNHMQFHMEYEGKLFVNPGSCGEALDRDATAAYTLIERNDDRWEIIERRVAYDLSAAADGMRATGFYEYAPMWAEIMEAELMSGEDFFGLFVNHLVETNRRFGRTDYPVGNDVWDAAVKTWDITKI